MNDNDDAPERALTDGPYSTKWMAAADKKLIKAAAKRARRTQGDWLGEAARAFAEREREPFQHAVLPPAPEGGVAVIPVSDLSMADFAQAIEIAARLDDLQKARKISARFASGVRRQIEARCGIAAPRKRKGLRGSDERSNLVAFVRSSPRDAAD